MGNCRRYIKWCSCYIEHCALLMIEKKNVKWVVSYSITLCPHPPSLARHPCCTHRKHLIFISHAPFHSPYPSSLNSPSMLSPTPFFVPLSH